MLKVSDKIMLDNIESFKLFLLIAIYMKLENLILKNFKIIKVPIGISNSHVHLTKKKVELLFGRDYELKKRNDISQPGQYACKETIEIVTEKGKINCRVVGPCRDNVQVEMSQTDAIKLEINAPIRLSGDIKKSGSAKLVGPGGECILKEGIIIAARHVHLSEKEAKKFKLKNNDIVNLAVKTKRGYNVLGNVICRTGNYKLDVHLDTDEANAIGIKKGDKGYIFY